MEAKKPIVYIDLLNTLTKWCDQAPDPLDTHSLQQHRELSYNIIKEIATENHKAITGYRFEGGFEGNQINQNQPPTYRTIGALTKYKELLNELRETCELRLISSTSKPTTLAINQEFNLGFDKKEIVSKEDISDPNSFHGYTTEHICPECLLISNLNANSTTSIAQRKTLGIEEEQQVRLQMLDIKCLEEPKTKNSYKLTVNDLAEELDTDSRKKTRRHLQPQVSELF